jgi:hypothetical protein
MANQQHKRQRRGLLALITGGAGLLALLATLAVMVARPAAPIDPARSTATTSIGRTGPQPWGHDVLRSHDPAKPKASPKVGPGLPASTVLLATQKPFVAMPAAASPPTLPDAYRGAMPAQARRTR